MTPATIVEPFPGTAAPPDAIGGAIRAVDDAERRRLANVHPDDWQNPSPAGRSPLVVIGAGTAGLVSAAIAAGLGARVALVERHLMGGDCLNVGCVPSKAMIRAARAWHEARTAAARFGGPRADGDGDFGAVMARMRERRARLSRVDSAARFRDLGVDVFLGEARFTGPDTVAVRDDEGREAALRSTHAEAIRKAADAHRREKLTPTAKRLFALFFRVLR